MIFGLTPVYIAAYSVFGALDKEYLRRTVGLSGPIILFVAVVFFAVRWYDAAVR